MKWIVGIAFGLLLLCVLVLVVYVVFSQINLPARGVAILRDWDGGRLYHRDMTPWDDMPMRPDRFMPFAMTRGFFPFGGLIGGLFCLGLLSLILLGIVALVVTLTRSRTPPAASPAPVQPATPGDGEEVATPARACPNCQRPVMEDWSHCPYCGTALAPPE